MTETQFKIKAVALLKKELQGAWIYHPSDKFRSGIPDLLILWRGQFAAIELKIAPNKPTRLQTYELKRISASGGWTWTCWNIADIREAIKMIKGEI